MVLIVILLEIEAIQADNRSHAGNVGIFSDVYIGMNKPVFDFEAADVDHEAVTTENAASFKYNNTITTQSKIGLKFN